MTETRTGNRAKLEEEIHPIDTPLKLVTIGKSPHA